MRLNTYVSGLGDNGDYSGYDYTGFDASATTSDISSYDPSSYYNPDYGTFTQDGPLYGDYGIPSTVSQNASSGWTNLLQNIIGTGVQTASHIATVQNAVPQIAPGTYYSYNPKTGQYTMTSAAPGSDLLPGSGLSLTPILLLGGAGLVLVLLLNNKKN